MKYLLDTNTVSGLIRKGPVQLAAKIATLETSSLAISVVTEAEILFGLERKPEATKLAADANQVLLRLRKLAWTSNTARAYATLRYAAERRGTNISAMDLLIASQAWEMRLILVTNDSGLHQLSDMLPVEDWM